MRPRFLDEDRRRVARSLLVLFAAGAVLAACGEDADIEHSYPASVNQRTSNNTAYDTSGRESVFGGDGLSLFGSSGGDADASAAAGGGVAVNSYLWRASLDTVSFMPLASADPFGGVIITDWYTPPEAPQERFKMNVYILDRQLRADGVRAAVFKQRQDPISGNWVDASVSEGTARDIEDKILTRARELRVATRVQ